MDLLSGLGDIVVVGPASAALFVGLFWIRARREAAAFASAIFAAMALALAAKLAFEACGFAEPRFDIESPSGHAALGAAFWGCAAVVLAGGRRLGERAAFYVGAVLVAMAVASARVAIGAHTVAEVICGLAIGAAATALFVVLRGPPRRVSLTPYVLVWSSPVVVLLALDLALFTDRVSAEPLIVRLAAAIGVALKLCA
jgi:membrane-associated phospholipid phosphatase